MSNLSDAVETFAQAALGLTDEDLERPWAWGSYDSEGFRFVFFRILEELLQLSTKLQVSRVEIGLPFRASQLLLGQYHAAFRNLHAQLLGINEEVANTPPTGEEWPVRRTLAHILGADIGFYVAIKYAVDNHRSGETEPLELTDDAWDSLSGLDEPSYKELMASSLGNIQDYHHKFHQRILTEFADIRDDELDLPSKYWEAEAMSIRFRLGRFTSHMRQHTIQIKKTLTALGPPANEINHLLGLIFGALAAVESARIGASEFGDDLCNLVAEEIDSLSAVINSD